MKAPSELPAAHSMDTTWFAIDADGHVGLFESSETGAVPKEAGCGDDTRGHGFETFPLRAACAVRGLLRGDWSPEPLAYDPYTQDHCALIVLHAPQQQELVGGYRDGYARSSCEDEIPMQGRWVLRAAGPRILASTVPLSPKTLRRLEKHPDVALLVLDSQMWWPNEGEPVHGVYRFVHIDYHSEGPGAYDGAGAPADPVSLRELPPETAAAVSRVAFPGRFAQSEALHLADHFQQDECATWHDDEPLRTDPDAEPPRTEVPVAQVAPVPRRSRFEWLLLVPVFVLMAVLAWKMLR